MRFGILNGWTDGSFEREVFSKLTSFGGKLTEQGTLDYGYDEKASYLEFEVPEWVYRYFLLANGDFEENSKAFLPKHFKDKKFPILSKYDEEVV